MKNGEGDRRVLVLLAALLGLVACGDPKVQESATQASLPPPAVAAPADAPSIDFVSEPNPPRAGDNAVSVQVRDTDGSPMTDLAVTVTYYMPPMPSMKMPEMRDSFPLTHKGEGKYSGNVRLSMGGVWAVTVAGKRGEETVAQRKLSIIAKE
jgi:hypothetical protein